MEALHLKRSTIENKILENYEEFIEAFGIEETKHEMYFKDTIDGKVYEFDINYNSDSEPAYTNGDIQVISVDDTDYVDFIFIKEEKHERRVHLHARIDNKRRAYEERLQETKGIEETEDWHFKNSR